MLRFACTLGALLGLALPAAAQGLPITRGVTRTLSPLGFEGRGFDPPPSTGRLDSDLFIPLGLAATPFGGTCTTGACANVGVRMPNATFVEGIHAVEGAPLPTRSIGLQSGALGPVGIRLRLTNTDTVTLPGFSVVVDWGGRSILGLLRGQLAVRVSPCDGAGGPVLSPVVLAMETRGDWLVRSDSFGVVGDIPPGGDVCLSFLDSTILGDLVAISRIEITAPSCGNGLVEIGEECESAAPCTCDPITCRFVVEGAPCGPAGPCARRICAEGRCVTENLFEGEYVEACEDGDPCTFLGCRAGSCETLVDCGDPSSVCLACDPVGHLCDVPIPSCCVGDADCPEGGACFHYTCNASHVCDLVVDPGCTVDAELPDASASLDASVSPRDAGALDASAFDASAFDASGLDASVPGFDAPFDAPPAPNVSFAGGGGCRCGLGAAGGGDVASMGMVALLFLVTLRRRR